MKRLIFGCGYLGERVAHLWSSAGDSVAVVTRCENRANGFREQGYQAIVADVTQPQSLAELPACDTVLFAVGYDRSGTNDIETVYAGGVRNVLAALPEATGQFIYISTTGVYGDAGGDWVDESTPPNPQRAGGKASLAAERVLQSHSLAERGTILRLAGIYGPGRIPYREKLQAGEPIAAPSEGWLNLIHVDDAAEIVAAVAAPKKVDRGSRCEVFCVSDANPVQRGEYYREVARLLAAPAPQFATPAANLPAAARAAADKRVSNRKLIAELGVQLSYPSHSAGLAAILQA